MNLNVINNELYEYRETFSHKGRNYTTVSYLKVVDYKLQGALIEEITVEQVIEIDKYLNREPYLSIQRVFGRLSPSEIKQIVNIVHQRKGGEPLSI